MLTEREIEEEKQYLKSVIEILKREIVDFDKQVKNYSDDIHEQMSYAWDKTNRLSDTEFIYALASIQKRNVYASNANKKMNSYIRMLDNTYFARIDFDDDETGEHLPIYIGISSVADEGKFYVFDWRAPISSMFYNGEVGRNFYTIPSGEKITGNVTLKRQYKISGGELKEVFDTDLQIIDDILKKILSSNASSKMKNIVTTIQKEQNELIRKNDTDLFVIQGPAGSGKTSIAMHKIAYLLYAEREKINNSNVMILSPNEIFNNYISDVLPGIGEENVVEATFMDFAKAVINEFKISTKIEDIYEIVYSPKDARDKAKYEEIKFKYDPFYIKILDEFIEHKKAEILGLDQIIINEKVVVSNEEIDRIIRSSKRQNESVYIEGKRILDKVFALAHARSEKHVTLEKMQKQMLDSMIKMKIKIGTIFLKLYSNEKDFVDFVSGVYKKYNKTCEYDLKSIFKLTSSVLLEDKIEFQDVTGFMYFKSRIIGLAPNKVLKYILIDEAQDYSTLQYKILAMLFRNSNITILGDLNQSIMPFSRHESYDDIVGAISEYKINCSPQTYELSKTYRSTFEINEFAKKVISYKNNYSQIDRHGDEVEIIKQGEDRTRNVLEILDKARELSKNYKTVAIICKNIGEIEQYSKAIMSAEDKNNFRIVTKNDTVFVEEKIMVIPSYLAKGLEFDAVIVSNANENYYSENERNLLYVVFTRALHKLVVFYSGNFTELFDGDFRKYLK